MGSNTKELVARLKLEAKDFTSAMAEPRTAVLAMSGAIAAVGVAALVAADSSAKFTTEQYRMAKAAGENVKVFSQLSYAFESVGGDSKELQKTLSELNSNEGRKAISAIGISLTDMGGQMKSASQLTLDLADKIASVEDPAKRVNMAIQALGKKDGPEFVEFLEKGSGGIRKLMEEAVELGQVIDERAVAAVKVYNAEQKRLIAGVEGLKNQFGLSIVKWLNQSSAMEKAISVIKSVIKWWVQMDDSTKNAIITTGAVVTGIAAIVGAIAAAIPVIKMLGVAMNAAFVTSPIGLVILSLAALAAATAYVVANWDRFSKFFAPVTNHFKEINRGIISITTSLKGLGSLFGESSVFKGIGDMFSGLKDIDLIATGIKAALFPLIVQFSILKAVIMVVVDWFKRMIEIGGEFKEMITAITDKDMVKAAAAFEKIKTKLGQAFFTDPGKRIDNAVNEQLTSLQDIITKKGPEITSAAEKALDMKNVGAGIENAKTEFEKFRKDVILAANDSVKFGEVLKGLSNPTFNLFQDMTSFGEAIESLIMDMDRLDVKAATMAFALGKLSGIAGQMAQVVSQSFRAAADLAAALADRMKARLGFISDAMQKLEDDQLARTLGALDAELDALNQQKEAMLAAERKYEEDLEALRAEFAGKRKAELDEETKAEFNRLEAKYAAAVAALDATSMTEVEKEAKKQDLLNQLMDQKNQLLAQMDDRLAEDIAANETMLNDQKKAHADAQESRAEELATKVADLEAKKTAAQDAAANKKEQREKALALFEWQSGKKAFELNKKAQVIMAGIGVLMGLLATAQAASMIVSQMGVIGIPIAATFAATAGTLIVAAGVAAVQTAQAAQYPPPPVFGDGGITTGPAIFGERGPELAIPLDNPGKDFGALKGEVARALVGGLGGGMGAASVSIENNFYQRDDYVSIRDRLMKDIRDFIRSVMRVTQ